MKTFHSDDLMRTLTDSAAANLTDQLEHEVQAALDAYAPGWTTDDVRWRCSLVSAGGPATVQTLKFDDTSLLEIYPVESEIVSNETHCIVRYTQKVKRLYRSIPA